MRPYMIGIGGPSCSGKSALAAALRGSLAEYQPVLASLDAFYRDLSDMPLEEREAQNFDAPEALEWPLLLRRIRSIAAGQPTNLPVYDFVTHTRQCACLRVTPGGVVIVEGLLALYEPRLRKLFDLRIYVDVPDVVCLGRRIQRDKRERGRTDQNIASQYADTVRPMALQHVVPTCQHAHIIIDGEAPLAHSVDAVLAAMNGHFPPQERTSAV